MSTRASRKSPSSVRTLACLGTSSSITRCSEREVDVLWYLVRTFPKMLKQSILHLTSNYIYIFIYLFIYYWNSAAGSHLGSYWMNLGHERIVSFEGGSSRSHYVEASFWRRLWTCRQTEYWMNESSSYINNHEKKLKHEKHRKGIYW